MTNKEIFYFTGKCLTLDEHPGFRQEIIDRCKTDLIDWQQFVALCSDHLILPVIYLKFQTHSILEYLPEELAEYLKYIYDLNLSRNNQILEQLQEITGVLNKNSIYPVFLKGAGNLLDGLYSNVGERILGDIDFLVRENDYLLSAKLLENEGYSMSGPCYMDVEDLKHYPRLSKPGFPADIEIHRLPVPEDYQSWFNVGTIDQEKKTVSALSGCYVLSEYHNIILNFIHSQLQHGGHINGIVSFRDLYDLYLLSKRADINEILPHIKIKRKAIVYFRFAGKALGLSEKFYPNSNLSYWIFIKKHDLNLNSKTFYYIYRTTVYILKRIIVGYTSQFIKSFYSKKMRKSVVKRLSNRKWYIDNLHSYKIFFSRNK